GVRAEAIHDIRRTRLLAAVLVRVIKLRVTRVIQERQDKRRSGIGHRHIRLHGRGLMMTLNTQRKRRSPAAVSQDHDPRRTPAVMLTRSGEAHWTAPA